MFFTAILFVIEKFGELIISKACEKVADSAVNAVNNVMGYASIVKTLKDNLKLLKIRASDVEDEIRNAELSGNKKRKREVEEWLRQVKSIDDDLGTDTEPEGKIMKMLEDGGKVEELNKEVEKLYKQSRHFGTLVLHVRERVIIPTTEKVGKAFKANLEKIWRLVEMGEVPRIAVCGMGGVGKTALAEHIHNRLVKQCKGDVFLVTVSQVFTTESLQDKIAHSLGVQNLLDKNDEIKIRAGKLKEDLSKLKNSVLILDDVWEKIDLLELGYDVPKECCRLIITTRSDEVCNQMDFKGDGKISVQKLDEDEAWELFSATLGKERSLSPEMEKKERSVAKLCDGLPLAIITVAGSLRGEESMHKWREAKRKLRLCEVEGSKVFNTLKYSFDELKKDNEIESESERSGFNSVQLSFLYCSLYPEDFRIPKEGLVEKLVIEGLVEGGNCRRDEVDQGKVIVDKLERVCLLESCVGLNGIECVKMHDLIRAMALKITKGKYMVRSGNMSIMEQEWTENLEKVSLTHSNTWRIDTEMSPNCPNLSTLLLQHNFILQYIGDSFFCRMQGLRTLDLSHTIIDSLPESICELKSLEAMLLDRCVKLKHVPNLTELKALRELHLDGTAINEVPQGVETLLNLKVLSLASTEVDELPRGLLLNLVGLQILRLSSHVQVAIEEIQNLKQVEVFTGALESVGDFNSFILSREHDHTTYKIKVGRQDNFKYELEIDFGYCDKAVILTECSLENENVSGLGIECLVMRTCEGLSRCLLDDLSRWNDFESLKVLAIESCGGIESIFTFRSEQAEVAASLFSTLEEIDLTDLEDLEGLFETGGASTAPALVTFSSLTRLQASNCMKMKRLGLPLSGFPKLISLHLWECGEIEEIFKDELGRRGEEIGGASSVALTQPLFSSFLTRLYINECNKVRKLGVSVLEVPNLLEIDITECSEIEEIFEAHQGTSFGVALPKLQKLTLKSLPRLKSVCNAPIICRSIQGIDILECPVLTKKLPLHFVDPPPQSLKKIVVEREWWASLEWDNTNLPALLQPFLAFRD